MLREGSHAPCRCHRRGRSPAHREGTEPGPTALMLAAQVPAASMHATMLHVVRWRLHACVQRVTCSVQHACRTLQRTTCTVRHATCAKPVRSSWCSQRRRRWPTWHACCMMSVACCVLPDVCCLLRVCACYTVGLGRRSGVGWLPSGCTRCPRAGAVKNPNGTHMVAVPQGGHAPVVAELVQLRADVEMQNALGYPARQSHAPCKQTPCSVQRVPSTEPCARCIDAADSVRRASRAHASKRMGKRATLSSFVAAGRR